MTSIDPPASDDDNPYVAPQAPPEPGRPGLGIASVMILIAAIAGGLAVAVRIPGLGIPLLLILVPAQVRTTLRIGRRRAAGRPLNFWEKVEEFASSAGVTLLILAAAGIAFVGTCLPVGCMNIQLDGPVPGPQLMAGYVPWVVGTVGAVVATYFVGRRLWPHKKDRP